MRRMAIATLIAFSATGGIQAQNTDAALTAAESYSAKHQYSILNDFREFLRLPNHAHDAADIGANATWIEKYLSSVGFKSRTVEAGGAPYVLASKIYNDDLPTILIYAHFDGQPVHRPEWESAPFEPVLRSHSLENGGFDIDWSEVENGGANPNWRIFARSAADDKAPIIALVSALRALDAADIEPAVNIKLLLDGEEEVGSPTLGSILATYNDELKADLVLFSDGPVHQSGRRHLVFGVRGDVNAELTTFGAARPLHSGHYGNWAPNPNDAMIRLLASLKNQRGELTIRGIDRTALPPTTAEKEAIAALPRVEDALRRELALGHTEGGDARLDLLLMRPAVTVRGFDGGPVGDKARNVIPATARASLDIRLVPGQSVADIRKALETHFLVEGFHVVHEAPSRDTLLKHPHVLQVQWDHGYPAYRSDLAGPAARQLKKILQKVDGSEVLTSPTMGGSLPLYLFEEALPGVPVILMPVANYDNYQHGPNENLRLGNLFDAVKAFAAIFHNFTLDIE